MAIDVDGMVSFAQALVQVPSVHDPARGLDEASAAELVAQQMRELGWSPEIDLVAPGRPNVVVDVDGGAPGPILMFEGHTDVVTEGDRQRWSVDPFGGVIADGRLWGRGAADMKAGIAAMVFAADELARTGFAGRVRLAALVDEEGMMVGAKHLVASGRMRGVAGVICCEPEGGEICHVAKGALRLRVDLAGAMAHGAMPFLGNNPNAAVGPVIDALGVLQARIQHEAGDDEYLGVPWVTPTVIRSGEPTQMNVMPGEAAIWVDVRTVPSIDHRALVADLRAAAEAAAAPFGIGVGLTVLDDRPSVASPSDHPLVTALLEAHRDLTGSPGRLGGVPGATDGTVLTSRTGIASVVCGPGGKWIAHQVDEFVELDDIVHHANLYVAAARRFFAR